MNWTPRHRPAQFAHAPPLPPGEGIIVGLRQTAVAPDHPHVMRRKGTFEKLVLVGHHQAAFPAGDVLIQLQAEDRHVTDAAELAAAIAAAVALGAILQHLHAVLVGERHDPVHVAGGAGHVDGHDDRGALGDALAQRHGIEVERVVDLTEHRNGPHLNNRAHGGHPKERRDDHFAARADPQRRQRADERPGSAVDRERMLDPVIFAGRLLEIVNMMRLLQPIIPEHGAAAHHVEQRLLLLVIEPVDPGEFLGPLEFCRLGCHF